MWRGVLGLSWALIYDHHHCCVWCRCVLAIVSPTLTLGPNDEIDQKKSIQDDLECSSKNMCCCEWNSRNKKVWPQICEHPREMMKKWKWTFLISQFRVVPIVIFCARRFSLLHICCCNNLNNFSRRLHVSFRTLVFAFLGFDLRFLIGHAHTKETSLTLSGAQIYASFFFILSLSRNISHSNLKVESNKYTNAKSYSHTQIQGKPIGKR